MSDNLVLEQILKRLMKDIEMPNTGWDTYICPFCNEEDYHQIQISHKQDCSYEQARLYLKRNKGDE